MACWLPLKLFGGGGGGGGAGLLPPPPPPPLPTPMVNTKQNISIKTNILYYPLKMMREIIFTNYVKNFCIYIPSCHIKFRFRNDLQRKCLPSDIIFTHIIEMSSIKF